jgi:hypothetical protein
LPEGWSAVRPAKDTGLEFLTGKTRRDQVKFRCDCKSALSQRFFSVD